MLFDSSAAGGTGSSATYRSPEFIAVILAGEGSSANAPSEYISTGGNNGGQEASTSAGISSSSSSKSVLQPPILQPLEGKPRIDSILKWIEEAGVSDAVILAPEWQHSGLTSYLRARKAGPVKDALPGEIVKQDFAIRVDLQELDEDAESETGSLRTWSEKNPYKRADLIILPPDFVENYTTVSKRSLPPLATLLDRQRIDRNLVTTLLLPRVAPTSKKQKEAEMPPLMLAYSAKSSTLLDIRDLDEFEDDVVIRTSLLDKFPSLSLSTNLNLGHVYVCPSDILKVFAAFPELRYFEEQALRWICKSQWQSKIKGRVVKALDSEKGYSNGKSSNRRRSSISHRPSISSYQTADNSLKVCCIIAS